MGRKKKLRLVQITLLIFGLLIIFFTYIKRENNFSGDIIPKETKKKIEKQLSEEKVEKNDIFYNVEYSGFDLNGNRYIIKCKEAITNKEFVELINMKTVDATFFFKNDLELVIKSDEVIYNNETLDIKFSKNIKGTYLNSKLFAQNANYSNSGGFVSVSDNVEITDPKGTMFAKKLLFDIKAKTLKITSEKDDKVKANINIKWKRVLEF